MTLQNALGDLSLEATQQDVADALGAPGAAKVDTDTVGPVNGKLRGIVALLVNLLSRWPAALGAGGGVKVDGSGTALPVSGTVTANAGSGTMAVSGPVTDTQIRATPLPVSGTVTVTDGSGSLTVDGTVAATQSGTWTVLPGNTANTTAWKVDGSAVTQPVSGTVTANAGTGTFGTNMAQVAGTATDVNSGNKSAGTQRIVLATDQPQLTNALKVDGSAVTQPVSGTVTSAPPVYTTVAAGEVAVSTSDVVMPTVTTKLVMIKALAGNAGKVHLGITGVTAAPNGSTDTTTGLELSAGESTPWIPIDNLNRLHVIGTASGSVTYLALA